MPAVASAGIALLRCRPGGTEILLGHLGGPYWARRDDGAWTIPKGELEPGEHPLVAACREFREETGLAVPASAFVDLGEWRVSGSKRLRVWAAVGDLDPDRAVSGTFEMEWPPRSGRRECFPELDRLAWWPLPAARDKVVRGQVALIDRLLDAPVGDVLGGLDEAVHDAGQPGQST